MEQPNMEQPYNINRSPGEEDPIGDVISEIMGDLQKAAGRLEALKQQLGQPKVPSTTSSASSTEAPPQYQPPAVVSPPVIPAAPNIAEIIDQIPPTSAHTELPSAPVSEPPVPEPTASVAPPTSGVIPPSPVQPS